MPPDSEQQLPFITRKMLRFEEAVAFSLIITARGGGTVNLVIRGITREGIFTFRHNSLTDTTEASRTFRIPDIPIFLTITDEGTPLTQGRTFVSLSLLANGQNIYNFFSGFVYDQKQLSWPQGEKSEQVPGGGLIGFSIGTDQAAGVEATITVPANEIWKIRSIVVTLVAANVVGTRRVAIRYTNQGSIIYQKQSDFAHTILMSRQYCFANHAETLAGAGVGTVAVSIPQDMLLRPGTIISTVTAGLDAGDNYDAPVVYYEKYPTGETT